MAKAQNEMLNEAKCSQQKLGVGLENWKHDRTTVKTHVILVQKEYSDWTIVRFLFRRSVVQLTFLWCCGGVPPVVYTCVAVVPGPLFRIASAGVAVDVVRAASVHTRVGRAFVHLCKRNVWENLSCTLLQVQQPFGKKLQFLLTSTLTAYLTPNTHLSTPRLKYYLPKINTHQLSSFVELHYCCCYPIKSLTAAKPGRVC